MAPKTPRPKLGRPPLAEVGRTLMLSTKLTPAERKACLMAAKKARKSASEWLRDIALFAATELTDD